MAINSVALDMLMRVIKNSPASSKMVCLGYPDMLVTEDQLCALCGIDILKKVAYRDDSESILRWHNLHTQMKRMVATDSLFAALGIDIDFIDIAASRGIEKIVDLNLPLPETLAGQYDIVYDGGTMEHCFNVGQVIQNICALAKVGGHIVHLNPLNYYNHGFYNPGNGS